MIHRALSTLLIYAIVLTFTTSVLAEEDVQGCVLRLLRVYHVRKAELKVDLFSEEAPLSPYSKYFDEHKVWAKLVDPLYEKRDVGLKYLRKVAQEEGIFTVLPTKHPKSEAKVRDLEIMYGTKVVFAGDHKKGTPYQVLPGVALHPGNAPKLSEAYRGTVNPHLGSGKVYRAMNKWREYVWVHSVDKDAMPETIQASKLFGPSEKKEIEAIKADLKFAKKNGGADPILRKRVTKLLEKFYSLSNEKFGSEGFFFKLVDEAQTGDRGQLLHSGNFTTGSMASLFLQDFNISKLGKERLGPKAIGRKFDWVYNNEEERKSEFVQKLIYQPEEVMIQEKLKSPGKDSGLLEFRVDFMDGEPVHVDTRHSYEYLKEQGEGASKFLADFFAKQKTRLPLSGGADVVLLEDGKYKILEMNFGPESGFADQRKPDRSKNYRKNDPAIN